MATLTAGSAGINMAAFGTGNPIGAPTLTATALTATLANGLVELYTGNFTVVGSASGDLQLTGGTATAYELDPPTAAPPTGGAPATPGAPAAPVDPYVYTYAAAVNSVYSISGANVSAAQMNQIFASKDLTVLLHSFLPGGDTYIGSTVSDTLVGQGGNDTFMSGGGTETFVPLSGANVITGGAGIDTVSLSGTRASFTVKANADHSIDVTSAAVSAHATNVENLTFADQTLFVANPEQANIARLYSAAFNRLPDVGGLNFWENAHGNGGVPTGSVAASFVSSAEFQSKYGALDNAGYIAQLYQNVLGRTGEAGGVTFWEGALQSGTSRGDVLVGFAEGAENIAKVAAAGWLLLA